MRAFSEARDWGRFHDLKSLTLALAGEVGEVAELVQWLSAERAARADDGLRERLGDELADVLLYLLRLADVAGIGLGSAALGKLTPQRGALPVRAIQEDCARAWLTVVVRLSSRGDQTVSGTQVG